MCYAHLASVRFDHSVCRGSLMITYKYINIYIYIVALCFGNLYAFFHVPNSLSQIEKALSEEIIIARTFLSIERICHGLIKSFPILSKVNTPECLLSQITGKNFDEK